MPDQEPYYHRKPPWRTKVDRLLDALLPASCLLCGTRCDFFNLCRDCQQGLPYNISGCQRCALPTADLADGICGACMKKPPVWRFANAPLVYEFPVDRLVQKFKYKQNLACGRALAHIMQVNLPPVSSQVVPLIIPVPLHWSRHAARGFNQACELAKHLRQPGRYRILQTGLIRSRRTQAQQGLDADTRRKNLKGAFQWKGPNLAGAGVLLVDDVLTTGSTVAECTRTLLKAGAGHVDILAAARAVT